MGFEDKTKVCIDCSVDFVFTAGEQEFFADKGLTNEPKRCGPCRREKKKRRQDGEKLPDVEVICDDCDTKTTVPFKPTEGKPVYCRDCFDKHRKPAQSR